MSPKTLFKIMMFALCYLAGSLAWAFIAIPELIGSSSDALVIAGFFGTGIWVICTACIVQYVLSTRKVRVNQISETGESVNQTTQIPGSFTTSVPTAFNATNVVVSEPFNIDDHVRLVADARRYQWLKDCELDEANELLINVSDDEWDAKIDKAIQLRQQEAEPCAD